MAGHAIKEEGAVAVAVAVATLFHHADGGGRRIFLEIPENPGYPGFFGHPGKSWISRIF